MFPSSLSLINPKFQNNLNRHSVKVTSPEEPSLSTTTSTGIPNDASPELLSDSTGLDGLSEANRTENSFEDTNVVSDDLLTDEEFLAVPKENISITTTSSNLSSDGDSSRLDDEKKRSNGDEDGDEDEDEPSYSDCDMFEGEWVKVEDRNLYYPPGSCPYLTRQSFSCQGNGRPDDQYLQWQWEWLSKQTNPRCNDIP
ncbi:hypothetical protein MKW94_010305, partial [Papaver nudicaule]|nr:hypothetical protein [Papaver nudicaule]